MKNVSDVYTLTPMQQLMLIHARSNPQSDTLFSQFQYSIKGPLEREIFQQAWEYFVNRHPALQTIFLWKDLSKPLQVVRRESKLLWLYQDWRNLSEDEQQYRLVTYLKEDKNKGFDLDRNSPIRFGLFHLADEDYHLVWSNHHLILDRWCLSILADELPKIYMSNLQHKPLSLPQSMPFKSYISWLQQRQEADAKAFWQSEFMGYHNVLPLNALRSIDSTNSTPTNVSQRASFSTNLSEKILRFTRNEHLTLSTVLQCAWGLLMNHYNSQNEAIIGVTVSGRPADLIGVERIVGTFINNLPVRISADGSEKLIPWLKKYQKKMSEMQKYDYVSQDRIQKWCNLPFDQLLFDSLFIYQQAVPLELPLTENVSLIGIPDGAKSNIPITLTIEGSEAGFTAWISYANNQFSDAAVTQLLEQLQNVLRWFVENPISLLGELTIFSEEERRNLQNNQISLMNNVTEMSELSSQRIIVPPRTTLESLIVEIWAGLLNLETVGIDENFFDLGGSSLLAIQLLSKIEKETGVSLPISVLFDSPNVRKLAEVVGKGEWSPRWKAMVAINDVSDHNNAPLFLVPPSATSAIHFADLAKHLESDYPVYSFTPIGLDTDEEPQNRVEDMAELYIREIRDIQPNGPYQIAGSCFGNLVAYEMAQQLENQGESTTLIAIDPFYLTQWKPEKRGIVYYLYRTWQFLRSGVLISEFFMRTSGLLRRYKLEKQEKTKNLLHNHDLARTSYIVQPFPGKLSFLQSEENHRLGYHIKWNELNEGSHESFVIPETNHGNLLSRKNLKHIANTIVTILEKQSNKL
jgi:thioesterase domain-containing protein/acyl carrier protein